MNSESEPSETPIEPAYPAGTVIENRFEIIELCGQGQHGFVFKARNLLSQETVAIKILKTAGRHEQEQLLREAKIVAQLKHEGIVACKTLGSLDDGSVYLVMEYLDGMSLAAVLERKLLSFHELASLLSQVIEALSFAHENNVVHRDIKPANIFVCDLGSENISCKILDFGIARFYDPDQTQTQSRSGILAGTPAYMSPECCRGEQSTPASDVYSFAVILYECLFDAAPFEAASDAELMYKQLHEEIRYPKGARVSVRMQELLRKCLAKVPKQRIADASLLKAEFANAVEEELRNRAKTSVSRKFTSPAFLLLPTILLLAISLNFVRKKQELPAMSRQQADVIVLEKAVNLELGAAHAAKERGAKADCRAHLLKALETAERLFQRYGKVAVQRRHQRLVKKVIDELASLSRISPEDNDWLVRKMSEFAAEYLNVPSKLAAHFHYLRHIQYLTEGDTKKSDEKLKQCFAACEDSGSKSIYAYNAGLNYFACGNVASAWSLLKIAPKEVPSVASIIESMSFYRAALELAKSICEGRSELNLNDFSRHCRLLAQQDASSPGPVCLKLASGLFFKKKYQEALSLCDLGMEFGFADMSDKLDLLALKSRVLLAMGKTTEALKFDQKQLALMSGDLKAPFLINSAFDYIALKQFQKSADSLKEMQLIVEKRGLPIYQCLRYWDAKMRTDLAEKDFAAALLDAKIIEKSAGASRRQDVSFIRSEALSTLDKYRLKSKS
ncbi:MAG: serine/threonine protein kinase [Candidatus Obscuribacterales bacterium]|nr:serine/threonine protein kinase [Candidatus Obscuribacterales bacterium]